MGLEQWGPQVVLLQEQCALHTRKAIYASCPMRPRMILRETIQDLINSLIAANISSVSMSCRIAKVVTSHTQALNWEMEGVFAHRVNGFRASMLTFFAWS